MRSELRLTEISTVSDKQAIKGISDRESRWSSRTAGVCCIPDMVSRAQGTWSKFTRRYKCSTYTLNSYIRLSFSVCNRQSTNSSNTQPPTFSMLALKQLKVDTKKSINLWPHISSGHSALPLFHNFSLSLLTPQYPPLNSQMDGPLPFIPNLCEKGGALPLFPKLTALRLVGFIHTGNDLCSFLSYLFTLLKSLHQHTKAH